MMSSTAPKAIASATWLHGLPEDWKILRFKDVFRIRKWVPGLDDPQVLSLTMNGVKVRDIETNEGQLAASYSLYQEVRAGDFVLNPMDLRSGWVAISNFEGVISNAYFVFELEPSKERQFLPSYFEKVFQWYYSNNILEPFGKGVGRQETGGGRWTLNADTLGTIPFPVPPLEEQRAIANYLDTKIAEMRILIEQLDKLTNLVSEITNERIRKATESNRQLGRPPGGWKTTKLKYIAEIQSGFAFASDGFKDSGEIAVVKQSDLFLDELQTYTDQVPPKHFMIRKDDVLVSMSGDFNVVLWQGVSAGLNQRCAYIRPKSGLIPAWLAASLRFALEDITSNNVSTTISNMSVDELKNARISIPPLSEQTTRLKGISKYSAIALHLQHSCLTSKLRIRERQESLIAAAITGKIDVRELSRG